MAFDSFEGAQDGDVTQQFRTKTEFVYEQLRRLILRGDLPPGLALAQDDLASQLGVSRVPLRQALVALEADGLITHLPHKAALVAPLSHEEIQDVYALREALESILARRGVASATPDIADRLQSFHLRMEQAVQEQDFERFVEFDRAFHVTLYASADMPKFSKGMVDRLRNVSDRYVFLYASNLSNASVSLREHQELISAYERGAADEAARLTVAHVAKAAEHLLRRIGEANLKESGDAVNATESAVESES